LPVEKSLNCLMRNQPPCSATMATWISLADFTTATTFACPDGALRMLVPLGSSSIT